MNNVTKATMSAALLALVGGGGVFMLNGGEEPVCAHAALHMTCEQAEALDGFEHYSALCPANGRIGVIAELKAAGYPPMPDAVIHPEVLLHPSSVTPMECPSDLSEVRLVPPAAHYPHALAGQVQHDVTEPDGTIRVEVFTGRCIEPTCICTNPPCAAIVPWEPMGSDTWRIPFCKALPNHPYCAVPEGGL